MTMSKLRCDCCGRPVTGLVDPERADSDPADAPHLGVRFSYHPGDVALVDDSGILCRRCWQEWTDPLGEPETFACALCSRRLTREESLFLRPVGAQVAWQLCAPHAVDQLNQLTTVEPKLDRELFHLPLRPPRG
ncbi:MAG: hypothetical protein R2731_12350 [Nocardioides sp.]